MHRYLFSLRIFPQSPHGVTAHFNLAGQTADKPPARTYHLAPNTKSKQSERKGRVKISPLPEALR